MQRFIAFFLSKKYFIGLAFIEGAAVMASELLGAKLITPFFGSSLYVWASVIGITLFGLTAGYYLGGYFTSRYLVAFLPHKLLVFGGIMISIMPLTSVYLMSNTIEKEILWASISSLLLYLFPIMLLLGASTPAIIHNINLEENSSGKTAGIIYAISTLGGIFATFYIGFWGMDQYGITWMCFFIGVGLIIISMIPLLSSHRYLFLILLIPLYFIFQQYSIPRNITDGSIEIIHESEGIFGQIRVIDAPVQTFTRGEYIGRTLFVNNIGQSTAFRDNLKYDSWDWSYFFPTVVSMFPKRSDALLMGLGGGTIVHQYQRLGFDIEVVELDKRIHETAIRYFGLPKNTNVKIDDARHYINTCRKTYDVITFDMFLNETPPAHVLTIETFLKIKSMLRPNGLWVINYFGYTSGSKGKSARSILKTLRQAGFSVEMMATPSQDESDRNIIFLASHSPFDFSKTNYTEPNLPKILDIRKYFLDLSSLDMDDAEILSDVRPRFDHLYLEPSIEWRKSAIEGHIQTILDAKLNMIK